MIKIFNKLFAIGFAAILMVGCTDGFEEMNENPNEPTDVPAEFLLTGAQKRLIDRVYGSSANGSFGMVFAQYWSQNEYTEESRYQLRANDNDAYWSDFYTAINNLDEIIRLNEETDLGAQGQNQVAVARIMKAWAYQFLTDIYGDVPYFEANQGFENPSPSYTPQAEIYADLLNELTEASSQIDTEVAAFDGGDLIYEGSMASWKKFANSLKLRVAIRMADVDAATAGAAISAAVSAGVFESNADNASLNYLTAQPNTNPLFVAYFVTGREDFAASDVMVGQLQQRNDPRLSAYFEPANNSGEFIGLTYGLTSAAAASIPRDDISQLNARLLAPDFEGMLMDYAEVAFIMAEAAARGFSVPGSAGEWYNTAVTASMNYWGINSQSAIDNYLESNAYNSGNFRQSIGIQKWIGLYIQGVQGWVEYRRLDFAGVLRMPAAGPLVNITSIPARREFPNQEQNLNRANFNAAVANMGADSFETKVWWDVN